jgi:hypothetical protein
MNDLLNEYDNDVVTKQSSIKDDTIQELNVDLDSIVSYNENVPTLDELYANLSPVNGYIVRVFLHEPIVSEMGILIPHKQIVSIPTQNGMAEYAEIETPYPYSNKAIIVAAPQHATFLKQGDIVQIGDNPVKTRAVGSGKNATVTIPSAYLHPESKSIVVPTDVKNRHYGYLLINHQDIVVKL